MSRIKISSDGTRAGTSITVDGERLDGVTAINYQASVDGGQQLVLAVDGAFVTFDLDAGLVASAADEGPFS